MWWSMPKSVLVALVGFCVVFAGICAYAQEKDGERLTLRFDNEMAAIINARHWDETKQQWLGDSDEMFFDGVHRFLLLRFPGCAEAIHEKLAAGYQVESAKLILNWSRQEWLRAQGYSYRGYVLQGKEPAKWHARIWLLRRPWTDDAQIGPTWNAYINGAGYWRQGGARSVFYDRFAKSLGKVGLWKEKPVGELDVTEALVSADFGTNQAERLRTLEACGFLIRKDEQYSRDYGEKG